MTTKKTPPKIQNLQKKNLGKLGEQLIKKKLLQNNWTFISQNYHTRYGEIDLIFLDLQKTLVFIEVKTRSNSDLGEPEEAITTRKISSMQKAAQLFIQKNPVYENFLYRLDVSAINISTHKIRYYKNIIV